MNSILRKMCDHAFEWAGKQKGFLRVSQIHGESEIFAIVDDTWTLSEEKGEIQQEHMRFDAEARLLVKPCMHSIAVQNPYLALSSYPYIWMICAPAWRVRLCHRVDRASGVLPGLGASAPRYEQPAGRERAGGRRRRVSRMLRVVKLR